MSKNKKKEIKKEEIKNFLDFLNENFESVLDDQFEEEDTQEEPVEDLESDTDLESEESTIEPSEEEMEQPPIEEEPIEDIVADEPVEEEGLCKVVVLEALVSKMGTEHPNATITNMVKEKMNTCSVQEIKLFQLNIQPVDDNENEPMDGMTQVYEAIANADAVIISADLKSGNISSVLQACIDRITNHYSSKELRNKVFGTILTGMEESYHAVRGTLINFSVNMGMISGGDCHFFCCLEEGESLGDCDHDIETDSTNIAICVQKLSEATSVLRSDLLAVEQPMDDMGIEGEEDELLPFDSYSGEGMEDGLENEESEEDLESEFEDIDSEIEQEESEEGEEQLKSDEDDKEETEEESDEEDEDDLKPFPFTKD